MPHCWITCGPTVLNLTPENRREMPHFANTAAYIVTTRKGAIRSMPEKDEVLALLSRAE